MYPKMQEQEFQQVLDTCPVWVRGILETHKDEILQGRIPANLIIESAGGPAPAHGDPRGPEFAMYAERRFDGYCPMYANALTRLGSAIGESIALKGLLDAYEVRKAEQEKKAQEEALHKAQELARMQAESNEYHRRKAIEDAEKEATRIAAEKESQITTEVEMRLAHIRRLPYAGGRRGPVVFTPFSFPRKHPITVPINIEEEAKRRVAAMKIEAEIQKRVEKGVELDEQKRAAEAAEFARLRNAAIEQEQQIQQRVRELLERNE
jgi:hypothetical protein